MQYYLVLDLEMTGFEPGWHEIIQIGACLFDENWQEKGRYLQNVYPENEEAFSLYAEKVHGLSQADLDDAPMMHEVIPELEEWILEKLGWRGRFEDRHTYFRKFRDILLCGQGVVNDINFLKFAYRQEKIDWPFSYRMLDLQSLSFLLFRILEANGQTVPRSFGLDAVAAFFGYEREGQEHNALEDAVITSQCLKSVLAYTQKLKLQA
ncbi:MAG: hypothetical protein OHK0053_35310 [Microscillaceae bacterium]